MALHNVGGATEGGGARRTTDQALPWDQDGRLRHVWLDRDGVRVSTVDLIDNGLALVCAGGASPWQAATRALGWQAPLTTVDVDDTPQPPLSAGPRLVPFWSAPTDLRQLVSRGAGELGGEESVLFPVHDPTLISEAAKFPSWVPGRLVGLQPPCFAALWRHIDA